MENRHFRTDSDLHFEERVHARTARDDARRARRALSEGNLRAWETHYRNARAEGRRARNLRILRRELALPGKNAPARPYGAL